MAYTCSSCGTTYASGWKCTSCEQNQLLKQSMEQQNDLMERNRRDAAYEARMNREMQEEQAEREMLQDALVKMKAEHEDFYKQKFSDIVLLIQTNTAMTIGEKFEEYCRQEDELLIGKPLSEMGGQFIPNNAKIYRKHFTDYILNNPAKAAEIAIVKTIFESKATIAKEKYDAYEEREEQRKREERIEKEAKEAEDRATYAETEVVSLEQKKKARYGCFFFVLLFVVISYIEFADGNLMKGLLSLLGVMFFGFGAWALGPNVTQEDIDSVVGGFVKGLNR